ncbi:hypothetical protein ACFV27_39935 [Streptomyces antimycoticus]|uniref:hypothetical protein n=1 Tax=Streptomyces antimycoticus TaxID=68175 RepID=UPI0036BBF85E
MSATTRSRLDDLISEDAGAGEESAGGGGMFFTELKADPGALGLDSLLAEVNKLQRVRGLQLPPELFGDVSEKLVAAWRARAAKECPSDLRAAAGPVRYTLLSTRRTSGSAPRGTAVGRTGSMQGSHLST